MRERGRSPGGSSRRGDHDGGRANGRQTLIRALEKTNPVNTVLPSLFDVEGLKESGLRVAERCYEPGRTIFLAGDPASSLYLLVEGTVRVYEEYGNYSQATVALLKDGGDFGELDLFGEHRQRASARTMTDCRIASVRKSDLRIAIKRHPVLAVDLFSLFSERIRNSEQTIEVLLQRRVVARLASLMPVLAERFGKPDQGDGKFTVPLTHDELAEMIVCTREAVSKALGELRSHGFIELGRREMKIMDVDGIKGYASGNGAPDART